MSEKNQRFEKIGRFYYAFFGFVLLAGVSICVLEIIMRTLFNVSYDFMISLSVWLTIWATLMTAGPLLKESGHISIDFIRFNLKGKPRLLVEMFNWTWNMLFGVFTTWGSTVLVYGFYTKHTIYPRYFAIPAWIVQLCVPIGMAIFSIYSVLGIVNVIREARREKVI